MYETDEFDKLEAEGVFLARQLSSIGQVAMTLQEVKQLRSGDTVGFAGILSTDSRQGTFLKLVNDYLALIDYGDHTEHNHITNLFAIA